ncbi:MAG: ABC transporter substrate-binding protein [Eubacteriales bacterium]|nr:ABC transporter substrate-binding protein [Eubacteriales bacterium]
MKRLLIVLLIAALCLSLAACGGGDTTSGSGTTTTAGDSSDEGSETTPAEEDVYEVIMQFPTLGTTPEDLQLVEDAINERTIPEIGVKVKFYPVSAFELNSTTNLMVSTGEKLDLMMSLFENGVGSYVNKGILIELDDLVREYGSGIVAAEGAALTGGYFDGKLYAIPSEEKMGRVKGFLARKDLLEKYNIEYDPNKVYSFEELTEIFATVKAGEGDRFYCVAINSGEEPAFTYSATTDYLGSSMGSGVLMNYGVDTTEVTNYFETEDFKTDVEIAREWFEKGYFSPDCNTTTESAYNLVQTGNYFGAFSNCEPDIVGNWVSMGQDFLGTDFVPIYTTEASAMTQFYQMSMWGIPITCENPEKTMQWLNMLYADQEIVNLVYRGIEGKHWQFVEGSETVVEYPEGIDMTNTPYIAILNVWGDKLKDYVMAPFDETYYEMMHAFNDSIKEEYTSDALGYCFNSEPVKTQFAAVQDVISQYQVSLGMGVVDPTVVLPEFQQALKAAGIEEIIAENQKQFDEWISNQ